MCPLDMKGIIGAATVVGCLQHGAGICDERSSLLVELKAGSLAQSWWTERHPKISHAPYYMAFGKTYVPYQGLKEVKRHASSNLLLWDRGHLHSSECAGCIR